MEEGNRESGEGEEKEFTVWGAVTEYFDNSARVKETDIEESIDFVTNRAIVFSTIGGIIGCGMGHTAGGMALDVGAANALKWGLGGAFFFSTASGIQSIRKRDDFLNYGLAGGVNYGAYRAMKLGPRGLALGVIIGSVGGSVYKICTEEFWGVAKESWLQKRRHELTNTRVVRINQNKVNPFPSSRGREEQQPPPNK